MLCSQNLENNRTYNLKTYKMESTVSQVIDFIFSKGKNRVREVEFLDDISIDQNKLNKRKTKFKFSSFVKESHFLGEMNFFPSTKKGRCHRLAVFVSMREETLSFKSDPNNFVPFDVVLKKMVQQVLGGCFDINKEVILITDTIDTKVIEEWKPNFRAMKKVCNNIGFYFVDKDGSHRDISFLFI